MTTCWPSSTATLTIVACIGDLTASPEAPATTVGACERRDGGTAAGRPTGAGAATMRSGRLTSRRLPATSTTTVWRLSPACGRVELAVPRRDVVDELGLDPAGEDAEPAVLRGEGGVAHDLAVERQHGGQARDLELVEGAARALERLGAVAAGDDDLGEQRVEGAAHAVAGGDAGVEPDAGAAEGLEDVDRAGLREEAAAGVLAVDAELDRVALGAGVVVADLLALGDAELLAHEVDAGDLLGDRVLDLQARVDLEERDRAVGADRGTRRCPRRRSPTSRRIALDASYSVCVLLVGEERRGRLFDELLVAALQRAVARRDDDDVARGIREALRLDVPRLVEVLLDEALAAAEGRDRLARRGLEQLGDLLDACGRP